MTARCPGPSGRLEEDLQLHAAVLGDHQRGLQGQLLDPAAARLVPGPDRHLDHARARHHHHPGDPVTVQPRVSGQRDPAGERHRTRARQLHRRAQQRVIDHPQAQRAGVRGAARRPGPVPLPLERVRRQLPGQPRHPGRAGAAQGGEGRFPVRAGPGHVQAGQGVQETGGAAVIAAQRAGRAGRDAGGLERLRLVPWSVPGAG